MGAEETDLARALWSSSWLGEVGELVFAGFELKALLASLIA
jgi:hypothetical protein